MGKLTRAETTRMKRAAERIREPHNIDQKFVRDVATMIPRRRPTSGGTLSHS